MSSAPPIVLTFAASDPTGGAGLQADVLTLASTGLPSAVGAHRAHRAGHARRRAPARDRRALGRRAGAARCSDDMPVAAFKIGVLGSAENVARDRRDRSRSIRDVPLVLDPVLASGRGDELADASGDRGAARALVPQTTVLTPNSLEARRRWRATRSASALPRARLRVRARHRHARAGAPRWSTRSTTRAAWCARTAGRACPAATTAPAARSPRRSPRTSPAGAAVPEAVREAQDYTWQALAAGFRPGAGKCIPRPVLLGAR